VTFRILFDVKKELTVTRQKVTGYTKLRMQLLRYLTSYKKV